MNLYKPVQLRYDSKTNVNEQYDFTTFGKSKGATYERVLVYAPKELQNYLQGKKCKIAQRTKNKLYVAMTRSVHSLTFVCETDDNIYNLNNGLK